MAMKIHNRVKPIPAPTGIDDEMPIPVEQEIPEPEPVVFDPEPPAKWSCMAEAIKAAQWELVHPEPPVESLVGIRNIWVVTEEELLGALPPDAAYPIERSYKTANRDLQLFLAGFLGALTMSTGYRFSVIATNHISIPADCSEQAGYEAYKVNVQAHEIAYPCTLWIIIIAEMSVGKSAGLNLFMKHIRDEQKSETIWFKAASNEYARLKAKATAKGGKAKEGETGDEIDADKLVRPWKTVFIDDGPTEAALHYYLQYNPCGIGYFKDEGSTLFSGADMYHKGGGQSLADRLLPTHDGYGWATLRKPDAKDNIDASIDVPRATVPIVCGIQPARLQQFVAENDESGKATRLTVTRAKARKTEAKYLTAEEIDTAAATNAEETRAINDRIGLKIRRMLKMRMIGECRRPEEVNENNRDLTPSLYSYTRHLCLTTEALVEYVNFRTYLKVSIENSPYGAEEAPFVDRDCGRILSIAGMLHVWQHCERLEERGGSFVPMPNSAWEIAKKPISLRTLQRAIIIVLYTMQTRRAEFTRFRPKSEDVKRHQLADTVLQHIAEHERYQSDIPFADVKAHLARQFPEMKKWSSKTMGDFLKNTLCLNEHKPRINGKQVLCYRLADALVNRQTVCAAPISLDEAE